MQATPLSVLDVIQVGVGPSASHTVGPMRAAADFVNHLAQSGAAFDRLQVELQGSLGATGRGHLSDGAVLAGLSGFLPDTVEPGSLPRLLSSVKPAGSIVLPGGSSVGFQYDWDMVFTPETVAPFHNNSLVIRASQGDQVTFALRYYSTGGGFVTRDDAIEGEPGNLTQLDKTPTTVDVPYPYTSMGDLLRAAETNNKTIGEIVRANEKTRMSMGEFGKRLDTLQKQMGACIDRGCATTEDVLPGGLAVPRRARKLFLRLTERDGKPGTPAIWRSFAQDPMRAMDWVNLWALSVNEENAAGGMVVRAPTNGSAGIVAAVGRYLQWFCPEVETKCGPAQRDYLTVAGAVGGIIKTNASVAGAEVGCQGEVGSAAAMAAGGLAAALGGSPHQIENAAEIAMEHHLGLTCDPIGGLVQVPCIERNAIAAVKAINAARMSLWGDGTHRVSFDEVIETMYETGLDMSSKYKETATGGLAVNVVEC
ncbi:L-serine ammonia-lyase [Mobiluncus sp.]|uniref:L-serine ammonia-lyase n=1 Tax=Mobiluncus sp. TaxID=47293 RepID=UPI002A911EC7|nr:L-serine ammonia-lyase [Mobiluncus sp.]MDY6076693.1 L-serine ammonia-lyase [Mobiluncus sp.]